MRFRCKCWDPMCRTLVSVVLDRHEAAIVAANFQHHARGEGE